MPIAVGTRLGAYEVLGPLGAGGMGEVYKARDTRLDRIVAIKVLPPHFADRPELRDRFEREARTIANLKHPHICVLYDIGHENGTHYLVMEYLEGETVAERLKRGPLPLDQVLQYAIEIADALDTAHRQNFTHRDIKPANIMLTKDGTKLLDFGLAKLKQEVNPAIPPDERPTKMSLSLTADGAILGTLQYMAPEQVEGKTDDIDGRTDIFAFGALVYEMATRKKAFEGKSQASVMAAILEREVPPMSSLQPMTPASLDRVVKKCLAKEREKRWQAASDLHDELNWIKEADLLTRMAASATAARHKSRERLGWVAAAVLLISTAVLAVIHFRETPAEVRPARFFVLPPEKTTFDTAPQFITVSPDGTMLAFQANSSSGGSGTHQLWVRPIDSLSARPLPGTEGAFQQFWSWDSRSIAFYAGEKLKKIDINGGPAQTLCDAPGNTGHGSWNRDGVILFAGPTIFRVSASGGLPTAVTTLNASLGETSHQWPHFLPDGKHFLYLAENANPEKNAVMVGSLDSKESKLLLNATSFAQYAAPGYLLFQRDGALMAQAFDVKALEMQGEMFPIAENVQVNPTNGRVAFDVSQNGVLAYRSGGSLNTQLAWFDRTGKELGRIGEASGYISPKLSPDGKQVAVNRASEVTAPGDIWVFDLSRGTQTRLTFDPADDFVPVWSPDGSRIAFASNRNNFFGLYQKNSNGIGQEELLLKLGGRAIPEDWSLDGRFIVYMSSEKDRDVWLLPLAGDPGPGGTETRKLVPFLTTSALERHAQLSPDGHWMAYTSNESGRYDVYVQSVPAGSGKWQVSTSGGVQPRWRSDGKELFYVTLDGKLMTVPVKAGATFEAGTPAPLFQTRIFGLALSAAYSQQYDVTADGQRFLIDTDLSEMASAPITVVLNWTAGIKKQ